ncbi:hypothetical protein [Nostoc sp. NMS8]|uniref:hypothetical protein n=1 Tax=Nostoc sp. NMS8 TaxID=2815392 RepID=UPI0025F8EAA8|nr:hypothetical protein [Nostoc sp. NMS8]MBN3960088.1 hypothetical protein [Nostoc sp. NMS8]
MDCISVEKLTALVCWRSHSAQTQAVDSALYLECVGAARRRHRSPDKAQMD